MGMNGDTALALAKSYVKKTLQGQGALKGQDGFSPTVKENPNNTADDYRFDVTDKNGTFTTPNLIGKEGKDGKTPTITIGANDNWFVDGIDTGVKAKGEKGDTGSGFNTTRQYSSVSDMMADTNPANDSEIVVVVLGDVGNFYMRLSSYIDPDGVTNGYLPIGSAQDISTIKGDPGKDGTDGLTPHIDSATKHWFLGTNDTGVTAEGKDGVDGVDGVDGTDGIDGTNVTVTEFSGNNGGIYKLVIQDVNGTIITPNLLGINGGGDTPVGHILSYMGITAPEHYLVCNGAVYNISEYPELANHFQREFGSSNFFGGDGTTTFAVPDLRGEFLRGTGTNSHANQGSGADVGVHQDATKYNSVWASKGGQVVSYYFGSGDEAHNLVGGDHDIAVGNSETAVYVKTQSPVKNNTNVGYVTSRPTNTSVLYCIKCESTEQKDTYSTDEINVDTWVDGKPVYRKVIDGVTADTPDTGYVISSINDMETLVSYTGSILDNNSVKHKIGTYLGAQYNSVVYVDTSGNVYIRHGSAMVNKSYSLIIEYTKTTD